MNRMRTNINFVTYLALSIFFVFCTNLSANAAPPSAKPEFIIPFEIQNNFIILNFRINSTVNLKFIYDSGSEHSLFFEKGIAEYLQFKFIRSIQIFGSDLSMPINATVASGIHFETENKQVLKSDIIVLDENIFKLNEYFGIEISGIIGNSMFRNKIIELDYDKSLLKIYAIEQFNPGKLKFKEIPSKWIKGKPYVLPEISTTLSLPPFPTTLLFDTGASIGLLLYTNFLTKSDIPDKLLTGAMGMGLGGPIEGYIGRVDNIIMEDFKFDNVITHYQKLDSSKLNIDESDKHGIMGNALISHFNVALDFSNQKLYLKKNSTSNKKMDVDRSGLFIIATGTNLDEYVVKDVIKSSAAEDAGILPGDIIHRFNGLTIRIFTLSDLNSRLSSSRKKKIKMVLIRDGIKMKKTIYLRDVI